MATEKELMEIQAGFFERISDVEEDPRTEFTMLEVFQHQPLVSITTATHKLNEFVRSISQDLSVVKDRIAKVPADNLSPDESAAIYLYTMERKPNNQTLYECLNNALRTKTPIFVKPYVPFLKLLITALSKLEPIGQTLYRGVTADLSEKYLVGKTFVWSGFSSCTTSAQMLTTETLNGNRARTLFIIHCLNGRNIGQHSAFTSKDEIIILPGTKFKVISKLSPSTDLHIIEIQEIGSSNLFRQRSLSISNEINTFSLIESNSKQINFSKSLTQKIDEQRDKTDGDFSSCKLNDEQVISIANEIKTNTTWKMLKLNDNKIGNSGMRHLSSSLVLNITLDTLFLDDNYVGDYGIRLLSDALKPNSTLVNLTLAGNEIKEAGAKILAELLRTNSTLIDLSLEANTINDNGMIALCETLEQYNRTLKKLWINNNIISDQSVEAIVAFRSINHVLDDFKYDGNKFSKQALDTIQIAIKKHEELVQSLSMINEIVVVYLELKNIPEKRLTRDAAFLFTNFHRLANAEALENFLKLQINRTIYLILSCEDDLTIRLISTFCMKKKIFLYVHQTTNSNIEKNTNIFNCEESMMFRLVTRIANQYRSFGDQAIRINEKEQAKIYFQQGIDIQQNLVNYLKKRRNNPVVNQNGTNGIQKIGPFPDIPSPKSLISTVEN